MRSWLIASGLIAAVVGLGVGSIVVDHQSNQVLAAMSRKQVNLVYAQATGSFLVLLAVAEQQRFFEKFDLDVRSVPARGATVPRLTSETPIGLIGEPAALLQAAEGTDLRIVASFSSTNLSGHLVARPGIRSADGLRGARIGVRVLGAGIWISTMLALEQLGLSAERDRISMVPIGSPDEIVRALEAGEIDAALVPVAQSRALKAKGYSVLLDDYPSGIIAYGGGLVVAADYLKAHPDIVQNVTAALMAALAFSLAQENSEAVMRAFKASLNIADADTAASNLRELKPKPYPSRAALEKMQKVMTAHDIRVAAIKIPELIEDRFVRALDESDAIANPRAEHGRK